MLPIADDLIRAGALVYDLVYNPSETRLIEAARERGARTVGGLPMLVYQGAEAFRLWTGVDAPVQVMFKAAKEALA
jgi:shikimate dehydrogenase